MQIETKFTLLVHSVRFENINEQLCENDSDVIIKEWLVRIQEGNDMNDVLLAISLATP